WIITTLELDVDEKDELGAGRFAEVFKGRWRGIPVAVKRLKNVNVYRLKQKAEIWNRLRHDHIVPFYGASIYAQPQFIVSHYMRNGHLLQYLHSHSDANRVRLLYDVSLGMHYLHNEGVVHGDLKGANVLIDDSNHALVSDFGVSFIYQTPDITSAFNPAVGTLRFMAPEAIMTGKVNYASDVYAYAMLIYEVISKPSDRISISDGSTDIPGRSTLPGGV
ncbi:kinase-like protein, partial [Obba rivulosa]